MAAFPPDWLKRLPFFRATPARLEEDGRVLHLFKNRAELKKAYSELQDEIHRLRDRIKQQEGATARVQDMMAELEQRLAHGDSGFTALVFYQLRDLWTVGRDLIAQMVGELGSQQEDRERRLFLADFNRQQFERRQRSQSDLHRAETGAADVREKLAGLAAQRKRAASWWRYFQRRELDRRIQAMNAELAGVNATLDEVRSVHEAVVGEAAPEFPGLSVDARRAINVAGIAYAELLCARLAKTPLVQMAREATRRREPLDQYGDQQACLAVMRDIASARAQLQNRSQIAQEVRARSERIRGVARYRSAIDTVPTEDSIAGLQDAALETAVGGGGVELVPVVLRDDTWDLHGLLLH